MPRQQLNIRIGGEERQAWTEAAAKAKLDLSSWIRTACNVAANYPRERPREAAQTECRHKQKRPGASGLLKCVDCGEVFP